MELKLLLRLAILSNSVVKTGSTFGQQLLAIKYDNISTFQKLLYLFGNCTNYIKTKLEYWKPTHEINNTVARIGLILQILDFINLSAFLRNGTKPLLMERFLGLNHVYANENAQRQFQSKYLSRELLWHGFIVS